MRFKSPVFVVAAATLVLATGAAALAPPERSSETQFNGCPTIVLYFSRGSSQLLGKDARGLDRPGLQLYEALVERFEQADVGSMANAYPAISVARALPRRYSASVASGVQSAERNIADLVALCPRSRLVLGGFSQGAQVLRGALVALDEQERRRVAAVLFFGDPLFDAAEANVKLSGNFDPRQAGIVRQLHLAKPVPIDDAYAGKVFSWCHRRDLVCQGAHVKNGTKSHSTYDQDTGTVARQIAGLLTSPDTASRPHRVVGTCGRGACALAKWSGPGTASFSAVGAAHEGEQVEVACQTSGETVTGTNGGTSAIWDELTDGTFVSDFYLDTLNVGAFSPPIPRCRPFNVAMP